MTLPKSVRALLTTVAVATGAWLIPSTPAAAAPLEKVLPFAGVDNVRVRVTLSGATGDVELAGRIVAADAKGPASAPPLWQGSLGKVTLNGSKPVVREQTVRNLSPKPWAPATPNLYHLVVEAKQSGKTVESKTVRFGFRTFEAKAGRFWLNGKPIFVRGIAINPPGRGVPKEVGTSRKFAEDYIRFMRAHNVNMIRLEPESDVWFDVADELGMMIYQGPYGSPPGLDKPDKTKVPPMDAALAAYRKIFDNYVAHPSIAIYVLSNELPYEGKRGAAWHEFLTKAHGVLKKEYPQPFIGNAGYGQGRQGDVNDVHRYWGWYYNSHLTFFNLRDWKLFGDPAKASTQPLTFSECVGAFSGPSGQVNSTFRKQLGAQLNWTGHAEDQVGEMQDYQAFIFRHAAESFRTMRPSNERLSGLMPFTILFRNWRGITSFDQMGHNANADQMTRSYSPVLLSWENWTPNVYAGATLSGFAHVVNDAEDFSDLAGARIEYELRDAEGKSVEKGTVDVPTVQYYATHRAPFAIKLPASLKTGAYSVYGKITVDGKQLAENAFDVYIANPSDTPDSRPPEARGVAVYDPSGKTVEAFKKLEIQAGSVTDLETLSADGTLVIGEESWDATLGKSIERLKDFVKAGGRVLVLGQSRAKFNASWLPAKIEFNTQSNNDPTYEKRTRPMSDGMHVNPMRPWHPALAGVSRDNLKWWSDHTGWDQAKPGFPDIYPVGFGFRLVDAKDLADTAIIANYDRGLEAVAIAEMFDGKGSVLMTSFRFVPRIGKDPVADRMLRNLVAHLTSSEGHELHPLVEQPIRWGNYPTERGVVVEPIGGLVVNNRWQKPPTDPDAKPLPDNEGAWNTQPGDGFVPFGRRVYGPWAYTNATGIRDLSDPKNAKFVPGGASPAAELDEVDNVSRTSAGASPTGTGQFWARVPAGRKSVVTKVENTGDQPAKIETSVNGGKPATLEIAPGQTATVTCEIPAGATDAVNVKFTADKSLVLLETTLE